MATTKKKLDKELQEQKKVIFTANGWEDYNSWNADPKKKQRVNDLIENAKTSLLGGIGKPERLSGDLKGYYSRRIDSEHRLLYTSVNGDLCIVAARFHY